MYDKEKRRVFRPTFPGIVIFQAFARKLIRRAFSGPFDPAIILNEVRAIENLCRGSHPNIIQVFLHGWLRPQRPIYFIDMELCDASLGEFIAGSPRMQTVLNWPKASKDEQIRYLLECFTDHVLSGLVFIHSHDEVHRDLNPRNRTSFQCL